MYNRFKTCLIADFIEQIKDVKLYLHHFILRLFLDIFFK